MLSVVHRRVAPAIAVLCSLVGSTAARPAHAQDPARAKVVILGFDGPAALARRARGVVVTALRDRATLVPVARLEQARVRTGAGARLDAAGYARLAAAIGADGLVTGRVTVRTVGKGKRRRARRTLTLALRSGRSGAVVAQTRVALPAGALRGPQRRALIRASRGLLPTLAGAPRAASSRAAGTRETRGQAGDRPRRARRAKPAAPVAPAARAVAPAATVAASSDGPGGRAAWLRGSAGAGWSLMARDLDFAGVAGVPDAMQPLRYERPPASGVTVSGEIFPLGFLGRRIGGLGVALSFERTVGLRTDINDGDEGYATAQQRLAAGLIYRLPVTRAARPIEVRLGLGGGLLGHTIDTGDAAVDLPDVSYRYVEGGLGVRVPVAGFLALSADARYLHVLAAGAIADPAHYGDTRGAGVTADGHIEAVVLGKIALRLGARVLRIGLDFDGGGLGDVDGDGAADVTGATDLYWGGYATAGYTF